MLTILTEVLTSSPWAYLALSIYSYKYWRDSWPTEQVPQPGVQFANWHKTSCRPPQSFMYFTTTNDCAQLGRTWLRSSCWHNTSWLPDLGKMLAL
jgi:hypothetical protein